MASRKQHWQMCRIRLTAFRGQLRSRVTSYPLLRDQEQIGVPLDLSTERESKLMVAIFKDSGRREKTTSGKTVRVFTMIGFDVNASQTPAVWIRKKKA